MLLFPLLSFSCTNAEVQLLNKIDIKYIFNILGYTKYQVWVNGFKHNQFICITMFNFVQHLKATIS